MDRISNCIYPLGCWRTNEDKIWHLVSTKPGPWTSEVVLVVKDLPANAGDIRNVGLIPGLGRSPRIGNGNPLQYTCRGNPMERGAWRVTVQGPTKESDMTELTRNTTRQSALVGDRNQSNPKDLSN